MIRQHRTRLLRVGAIAGLALGAPQANAQDSVSNAGGLPGDALSAYTTGPTGTQRVRYSLDLAPLTGSWGTRLAIGPLTKSSAPAGSGAFGALLGAQAAAPALLDAPVGSASYPLWTTPGQGVGPANGAPGSSVTLANQFGQTLGGAVLEFGPGADNTFGTGDDVNNIIGVSASWIARRPNRLYVTRTVAATNRTGAAGGAVSTASFGLGAADASGNIHLLADGYGMTSGARIGNKRWYRIDTTLRSTSLVNRLFNTGVGDAGATATLLATNDSLLTPTAIGEPLAGAPVLLGTDFKSQLFAETIPGTLTPTTSHLPAGIESTRGPVSFTPSTFAPVHNGVMDAGLLGALARETGETRTRSVLVVGVDLDGVVDGALDLPLPDLAADMVDPEDGFRPADFGLSQDEHELTNYGSQVSFRGGNGPVALRVLDDGTLVAGAAVTMGSIGPATPQGDDTYIAVARVDSAGTLLGWTVAAHAPGSGGNGKALRGDYGADGIPGTADAGEDDGVLDATPIGRLASATERFGPGAAGPSMSSPAMDDAGNLYFLSCTALNTTGGEQLTTSLVKATRNPGTGGYRLEVLLSEGDTLGGQNAGRDYRVATLGLTDADSIDSGAVFSQNTTSGTITWADAGAFPLSAMLLRARIVYDANNDTLFEDPEAGLGTEPDEAYNAMMVLMPRFPVADVNRDQRTNDQDFFDFINLFFGPGLDYNSDGSTNDQDFFDFINDFFGA